ncbi:phosphotransferase [Pseudoteredinibacter isoporae]|uniref:Thiamine kinase-like enzyme n=1 Tax=Pseudoteredinibacter isoporae TaxID=570281 RepID=A0A7X0JSU9_9GAMM|nr:phosphotransferase [Pseudoteredinibacter isoporae]MBB6521622.1 thiamine kinase-like enzyme [Pseudoteredinibacter isoporae]NHO87176.1 phosphotransferase [Pseudoteredinibacter isoporae]NIB23000.1 phosphotransferase [Pseudoteredinibacter isoporae]
MSRVLSLAERQRMLALLPEPWCNAAYEFSVLPSESNDNFLLSAEGMASLVLRIAKADAQSLGVNRNLEQTLYGWAANIGLSPELLWVDKQRGVMLSRYCADDVAAHDSDAFIRSLAEQLARLHSVPHKELPFHVHGRCIFDHTSTYKKLLMENSVGQSLQLTSTIHSALEFAQKCWPGMSEAQCLCHSDLHRDNILFHEGRVFFLDWEYTAITPAILDIASLAQSYAWNEQQLQSFYSCYLSAKAIPDNAHSEHFSRLIRELPVARFLLALQSYYWSLLHYSEGKQACEYFDILELEAGRLLAIM